MQTVLTLLSEREPETVLCVWQAVWLPQTWLVTESGDVLGALEGPGTRG